MTFDPNRCYWTFAPIEYDYWYVTEVRTLQHDGRVWRLVCESDTHRFTRYQTPRYASGNSPTIPLRDAAMHGLPGFV